MLANLASNTISFLNEPLRSSKNTKHNGQQNKIKVLSFHCVYSGGELPMTWYWADYIEKLPMPSMQLRPVEELGCSERTYEVFNGLGLYPFGIRGLSYTQFNTTLDQALESARASLSQYQSWSRSLMCAWIHALLFLSTTSTSTKQSASRF